MSIEEALVALHNAVVSQGGTLHVRVHGVDLDVVESLALGQYKAEAYVHRSLTAVDSGGVKQTAVSILTSSASMDAYVSSEAKPATSADFQAQAARMQEKAA